MICDNCLHYWEGNYCDLGILDRSTVTDKCFRFEQMTVEAVKERITNLFEVARMVDRKAWNIVSKLDQMIGEEETDRFLNSIGCGRAKSVQPQPTFI